MGGFRIRKQHNKVFALASSFLFLPVIVFPVFRQKKVYIRWKFDAESYFFDVLFLLTEIHIKHLDILAFPT